MAKHPRNHKPKLADVLRLGAEVAQTKASLRPKQWRHIVHSAHKQGFTVGGYLSGQPNALKERLPRAIKAEAKRNVATAYAPTYANLSVQKRQTQAMDAKRKTDDGYYQQWVQDQYSKLNNQQLASDNAVAAQQHQIQQDSSQAWNAAQAGAYGAAAATPGNMSNPQNSAALAQIAPASQQSSGMIANARQQSASMLKASADQRTTGQEAAVAQAAYAEAQRQGDTWKALQDIGNERADAKSKQGADTISELARLKGIQVSNAQSNREYAAAAQKLGIDSAKVKATALKDARNYGLARDKFDLADWTAKHADVAARLKRRIDYARIVHQDGRDAANRRLKREIAIQTSADRAAARRQAEQTARKNRHAQNRRSRNDRRSRNRNADVNAKSGVTDSAKARSEEKYRGFSNWKTQATRILDHNGGAANAHAVAITRRKLRSKVGIDGADLNIVMDLAVKGKLSPPNVKAARRLGLIVPKEWLP